MTSNARRATLAFLLSTAFRELFGARNLVIEHSFGDGYFSHRDNWEEITHEEIQALEKLMRTWLTGDTPLHLGTMPKLEILSRFKKAGLKNKPAILKKWKTDPVPTIHIGPHFDYRLEPMSTDKAELQLFQLIKYDRGLLLRFPSILVPDKILPQPDRPKLFSIIEEYENWGRIMQTESIPQLNRCIKDGIKKLVWIAEGLHEKKIINIADKITAGFSSKRVIAIAGPSSSGKTTFAKRLSIQLNVNGFTTTEISMDDYFMDRDRIPVGPGGKQDFESFEVVDVDLLTERIFRLLRGQPIPRRRYDFSRGVGSDTSDLLKLKDREFILIEGIHALNPRLTHKLAGGNVQKIYVSAMTQLNVDADHRVSTSDNRLLRRIVRDHKFRGYSPEETLERWPSVRIGEERNIFPFQEEADYMFNSALVYEFSVLSKIAKPLLKSVPRSSAAYTDAQRLGTLISFFEPLAAHKVPGISILREFIGNSEFNY
ncbi:MAG: nucleoside kinase [FCB group bacterium]|nr:nucleoside kinase [FCB group bacterium]